MSIRIARFEDAEEIQTVIFESVQPHRHEDFDEEGWRNFLALNKLESIQTRLKDKRYLTLCYLRENRIVGIMGILELEKIDQMFVLPSARKMGVAAALWNAAKGICIEQGNKGKFWVKSSTLAIPVYESFGFKQIGNKEKVNGISFRLMEMTP